MVITPPLAEYFLILFYIDKVPFNTIINEYYGLSPKVLTKVLKGETYPNVFDYFFKRAMDTCDWSYLHNVWTSYLNDLFYLDGDDGGCSMYDIRFKYEVDAFWKTRTYKAEFGQIINNDDSDEYVSTDFNIRAIPQAYPFTWDVGDDYCRQLIGEHRSYLAMEDRRTKAAKRYYYQHGGRR